MMNDLTLSEKVLYKWVQTHPRITPSGILATQILSASTDTHLTSEEITTAAATLTEKDLLHTTHNAIFLPELADRPTPETIPLKHYKTINKTLAALGEHHQFIRFARAKHPELFHPKPNSRPNQTHIERYLTIALKSAATYKCQPTSHITNDRITALLNTTIHVNHYKTIDKLTAWLLTSSGHTTIIKDFITLYEKYLATLTTQHTKPPATTTPLTTQPPSSQMTHKEWDAIKNTLKTFWPHAKTHEKTDQHNFSELKRFPAKHVQVAITSLYRDGEPFRPNSAKITLRIAELLVDPPTWGEVKTTLTHQPQRQTPQRQTCTHNICDGTGFITNETHNSVSDCTCRTEQITTIRKTRNSHPIITAFMKSHIATGEIHELTNGNTTVEAQMRTKYEQFTSRLLRSIVYQGIDAHHQPGELPGLDRILELAKTTFQREPTKPTTSLIELLNHANPTPQPVELLPSRQITHRKPINV